MHELRQESRANPTFESRHNLDGAGLREPRPNFTVATWRDRTVRKQVPIDTEFTRRTPQNKPTPTEPSDVIYCCDACDVGIDLGACLFYSIFYEEAGRGAFFDGLALMFNLDF